MVYDLTDKLSKENKATIKVGKETISVNTDALTVVKIIGLSEEGTFDSIVKMYELLFSPTDQKKIEKLKLNYKDWQTLVSTAMSLAIGEDPEAETENGPSVL